MTLLYAMPTTADTPPGGTGRHHTPLGEPPPTPSHAATATANAAPCRPELPAPDVLGYRLGGRAMASPPAAGSNRAPTHARPPT